MSNTDITIRAMRPDEIEQLPLMERAADQRFVDAGYFSEDDITPDDFSLARYQQPGHVWMAVDDTDKPAGFVFIRAMSQGVHIEELSVLPEHGRKGIGSALVRKVISDAVDAGEFAVTLSTDIHVPWNGPYYEKLGFEAVSSVALGQDFLELRQAEAAKDLDPNTRQLMIYYLDPVSRNEPATP